MHGGVGGEGRETVPYPDLAMKSAERPLKINPDIKELEKIVHNI
jgi:hypothetical protein